MISGFNTDIEYEGVVYHVQTEDKGLSTKMITSLIYDGGTILASKRTTYDDLANGNFDETILTERLGRQHNLICAAIRAGRLGELEAMTAKGRVGANTIETLDLQIVREAALPIATVEIQPVAAFTQPLRLEQVDDALISYSTKTAADMDDVLDIAPQSPPNEIFPDEPFFGEVSIVEAEAVLPAEAVAVVSELSGTERPQNKKLSIDLLGETKFVGGDRKTVNIMVCRGTDRKVVGGAQIMIKVLGSSFRPVIFHALSDTNGLAKVHLQLPHFQAGRAALLIRAMSEGEEIELRRIVTPG